MRRLIIALQFLTRLPTPRVQAEEADFIAAMRWFPAAGLIIGVIIACAGWLGDHLDPWVGALAALAAWVAVTGALHLDGLSDLADASGAAHKDRERFLTVMADPHVGSFGVVAIGLQLIAKIVLLHALDARHLCALVLIPFAARIGPLAWTYALPPLHSGLAARFATAIRLRHIMLWCALLVGSAVLAPAIIVAPILITGWGWWLHKELGGVSGDCHGAGIELVETGLLLALVVTRHI